MPNHATVDRTVLERIVEQTAQQTGSEHAAIKVARWAPKGPARLPAQGLLQLWPEAAERAGPSLPWQVARATRLEKLGVFGFAVQTAPDGLGAIETACALFGLISEYAGLRLDEGALRITGAAPRSAGEALVHEAMLAHFAVQGPRAVPGLRIKRIALRRALLPEEPARTATAHIQGGQRQDLIEFELRDLRAKTTHAHPELHQHLRAQAQAQLDQLRGPADLLGQVRAAIEAQLSQMPDLEMIAAALDVHPRTLRRRLTARGFTFRQLLDETRREAAERAVRAQDQSLTQIALELGFSELSAFSRAHRRWFGVSPAALRKRK